jgi:hypothetical protein
LQNEFPSYVAVLGWIRLNNAVIIYSGVSEIRGKSEKAVDVGKATEAFSGIHI